MEVKRGKWFECKVRYEKTQEDGMPKSVTETYVVDGIDFGDAFKGICEYAIKNIANEFEIVAMKMAQYAEIALYKSQGNVFYRVKINMITIDEKTAKQNKTQLFMLDSAYNINEARKAVDDEYMKGTMTDYEISSVVETKIVEFHNS